MRTSRQKDPLPLPWAEALERVLASEPFANSERMSRFLRFIVESTARGNADELKEYLIGRAVFDRSAGYDPRVDPIVRVEAGRLRAKLKAYYDSQGAGETFRIEIPKGGYVPVFQEIACPPLRLAWMRSLLSRRLPVRAILLFVVVLAALAAVFSSAYLMWENRRLQAQVPSSRKPTPLWRPFLASNASSVVVFGSPLFFEAPKHNLFFRFFDLNDPSERDRHAGFAGLGKRLEANPQPRFDYAQMGDAIAVQRLTAFFARYGRELQAYPAHLTSLETIRDYNVILVGSSRMHPLLRRLPVRLDFEFEHGSQLVNRNPRPGEQASYPTPSHRDVASYFVIACFPGSLRAERGLMILTSHSTAGLVAAADHVTRTESLRSIESHLPAQRGAARTPFQMLLKVSASQDEPFMPEFITMH